MHHRILRSKIQCPKEFKNKIQNSKSKRWLCSSWSYSFFFALCLAPLAYNISSLFRAASVRRSSLDVNLCCVYRWLFERFPRQHGQSEYCFGRKLFSIHFSQTDHVRRRGTTYETRRIKIMRGGVSEREKVAPRSEFAFFFFGPPSVTLIPCLSQHTTHNTWLIFSTPQHKLALPCESSNQR